jgi:hypothetical protein
MERRTPNAERQTANGERLTVKALEKGAGYRYVEGQPIPNPRKPNPELYGQTLCPRRRLHLRDVHLVRPCGVTHGGPSLCSFS